MSVYKKKTKYVKQKQVKESSGIIVSDATNGSTSTATATVKDIDAHPISNGNSIVVIYRDLSHRLAKVYCTLHILLSMADYCDTIHLY